MEALRLKTQHGKKNLRKPPSTDLRPPYKCAHTGTRTCTEWQEGVPGQTQSLLVSSPLLTPHGLDLQLVLSLVAVRPRALGALLPWPALLLVMLDLRKSDVGWGE